MKRMLGWVLGVVLVGGAISTAVDDPEEPTAAEMTPVADPAPASTTEPETTSPTPTPTEREAADLLFIAEQKDGDSWVASDGVEYRLGQVNAPELSEPCGPEAAQFSRSFLDSGFTADVYSSDTYGRSVAEVLDADGESLNVALARSGLGDARYLEQFRSENPDLAARLDKALAAASTPGCGQTAAPVPFAAAPEPATETDSGCMAQYSPCVPAGPDLGCPDIAGPVTVTGGDPFRLDRDGDGIGCD
ncbi:thermonuclease family protein [Aeromicrobium sp. CF3.5]|uniref:thermonuclease family protein n=1 Tax=Aeromicrobium sp. CF3.5 TaxID=3373078 RepID=UPI003EE433D7